MAKFDGQGDELEIGDSLIELLRTTRESCDDSVAVSEQRGSLLVRPGSVGISAAESWVAELTECSSLGVRGVFDRTMIVGDSYRIQRPGKEGGDESRLVRCVSCRLKEGESFEAELKYFVTK